MAEISQSQIDGERTFVWSSNPDLHSLSSATTAYPYLLTPSLLLHSATDTTIRGCYDDTPEFWQRWREEIADIGREIAAARPDEVGCYLAL